MGTLHLPNHTVHELAPEHVAALEEHLLRYDEQNDAPCVLCGGIAYSRTCSRCRHACAHTNVINGYTRKANGDTQASARCINCGHMVAIGLPRGSTVANVCVRDNLARHDVPPCVRCQSNGGVEYHHWAPQAIFNDADAWPIAPLCRTCHTTWHNAMRAARGVSLPPDQRIGNPWPVGA